MSEIKAVLFDLDGTLLDSDMQVFLPHYLQQIAARVAHLIPPKEFIAHLLAATQAMVDNDGRATNAQVFAEVFYPRVGHTQAELEPILMDFYERDYPALQRFTAAKPDARPTVQLAFDLGYDVVIATNPLFPETATRQRMAWADVDGLPYRRVTTYENSRFAKPNPRYFTEILAEIGCAHDAALVVGDEAMDMVAATVGCTTFLVPGAATKLNGNVPAPAYRGTLADVAGLLRASAS
jgi:HAD superfamily hydrolase (TIGR01549 family)